MSGRSMRNQVAVECPTCGWKSYRVYRQLDDLSGKPQGFGTCPKCRGALVRSVTRLHYVRKAS